MNLKNKNEITAIAALGLALLLLISFLSYAPEDLPFYTSSPNIPVHNWARTAGAWVSGVLFWLFGWPVWIIPLVLIFWSAKRIKNEKVILTWHNFLGFFVLTVSTSTFISTLVNAVGNLSFRRGGFFGSVFSGFLVRYVGPVGSYIISLTLMTLSFYLVTDFSIFPILRSIKSFLKKLKKAVLSKRLKRAQFTIKPAILNASKKDRSESSEPKIKPQTAEFFPELKKKPRIDIAVASDLDKNKQEAFGKPEGEVIKTGGSDANLEGYILPTLDLLDSPPPVSQRQIKDDLQGNALILEETLGDFGISVKVTDVERGPVITRYELEPAPGVKVQKITALGDDISLALKASSVRIVAPIPGKARVGIEVPNSQSNLVYQKEIISSNEFGSSKSLLTLGLGKDIAGNAVVTDLAEMPHLLIAGTTGSGKTVCVNCLITSMLYRAKPNELKFLMVDPKMVELMPFNGLPHLLCPVVTNARKASSALNWVVKEMENRYNAFAQAGTRNIAIYNQKNPENKIPYIVVIIDELADLMVVAAAQIENAITRLAQLSRAVGIHLILATQRPSVDVITGVIKANFPARVSFKVASKVDSRTVLDMNGADKLLGRGDMLFLKPGESKLIRAQGSLIQDREIERVVEFIKNQAKPVFNEEILNQQKNVGSIASAEKDELFDEAFRVIIESNQASVSILQRRLRLGYTRAARIIDSLEQENLIGSFEGSKPRKILVNREEWMKKYNQPSDVTEQEDAVN